ncbi:unnamed protein product [Rotaria socialis]
MLSKSKYYLVLFSILCIVCLCIPVIVAIYQNIDHYILPIKISKYYLPLCDHSSIIIDNRIVFDDASHFIHHYPEFICSQNFRNLVDWVYGWPENLFNEHMENTMNDSYIAVADLPHGSIIYIKPDGISRFFQTIDPRLQNQFVLITGQSEISVTENELNYLARSDSKIIHWFGQNGCINASQSERFTNIPIGLNCFVTAESMQSIQRKYPNYTLSSLFKKSINEPSYYIQPFDITQKILNNSYHSSDKLLLLNFAPDIDPTGLRAKLWKNFVKIKLIHLLHVFISSQV